MTAESAPARRRVAVAPLTSAAVAARPQPEGLVWVEPPRTPAVLHWAVLASPAGRVLAVANPAGLAGLDFLAPEDSSAAAARRAWQRYVPGAAWQHAPDTFTPVAAALGEPAAGSAPWPVVLAPWGSAFYRAIWQVLLRVPPAAVTTYGALAAAAGRPGAARAAGRAVATNPVAVLVPCHRVVPASGAVGNYGGGPARKALLLTREGALPPAPAANQASA